MVLLTLLFFAGVVMMATGYLGWPSMPARWSFLLGTAIIAGLVCGLL